MKRIRQELYKNMKLEIKQIGLTPSSDFAGTQEEHDNLHRERVKEYKQAIKILSAKCYNVKDWMCSENHPFDNFDDAENFYKERVKYCKSDGGEIDVQFLAVIDEVNNVLS